MSGSAAGAAPADYFIEIEYAQICKHGQVACGDACAVERIDAENRALAVLSDGLGSGIKASVLSEMTVTMAMRFLRSDMDLVRSVETIQDALPVDSIRRIAYATLSMVDLQVGGRTRLAEMGNPRYIQLRGLEDVPPAVHETIVSPRWPDRPIESYELDVHPGDRLVVCSDGVTQSGLENRELRFGWRRSGELEYARSLVEREPAISARDLSEAPVRRHPRHRPRDGGRPHARARPQNPGDRLRLVARGHGRPGDTQPHAQRGPDRVLRRHQDQRGPPRPEPALRTRPASQRRPRHRRPARSEVPQADYAALLLGGFVFGTGPVPVDLDAACLAISLANGLPARCFCADWRASALFCGKAPESSCVFRREGVEWNQKEMAVEATVVFLCVRT